jgi:hypothetical protein
MTFPLTLTPERELNAKMHTNDEKIECPRKVALLLFCSFSVAFSLETLLVVPVFLKEECVPCQYTEDTLKIILRYVSRLSNHSSRYLLESL